MTRSVLRSLIHELNQNRISIISSLLWAMSPDELNKEPIISLPKEIFEFVKANSACISTNIGDFVRIKEKEI